MKLEPGVILKADVFAYCINVLFCRCCSAIKVASLMFSQIECFGCHLAVARHFQYLWFFLFSSHVTFLNLFLLLMVFMVAILLPRVILGFRAWVNCYVIACSISISSLLLFVLSVLSGLLVSGPMLFFNVFHDLLFYGQG